MAHESREEGLVHLFHQYKYTEFANYWVRYNRDGNSEITSDPQSDSHAMLTIQTGTCSVCNKTKLANKRITL